MKLHQEKGKGAWMIHLVPETHAEVRQLRDLLELQPNHTTVTYGVGNKFNFELNLSCFFQPKGRWESKKFQNKKKTSK
jgi:hypothetical protein